MNKNKIVVTQLSSMDSQKRVLLLLGFVVVSSGCISSQNDVNPLGENLCDKNLPSFQQEVQTERNDLFYDEGNGQVWTQQGELTVENTVNLEQRRDPSNTINISKQHEEVNSSFFLFDVAKYERETGNRVRLGTIHSLFSDEEHTISSEYYERVCQSSLSENGSVSCKITPDKVDTGSTYELVSVNSVEGCGVKGVDTETVYTAEMMEMNDTYENSNVRLETHSTSYENRDDGWKYFKVNLTLTNKNISTEQSDDGITGRYTLLGEDGEELESDMIHHLNGPYNLLEGYSETREVSANLRQDQQPEYMVFQKRWGERRPLVIFRLNQ